VEKKKADCCNKKIIRKRGIKKRVVIGRRKMVEKEAYIDPGW